MNDDFFEIYEETYPIVLRYVVSKTDNISNISDIIQNVYLNFYKVYKKKNNYINNSRYFIIDIAKKEIFKYYHSKEKFKDIFSDVDFSKLENFVKSPEQIDMDFINKYNREMVWSEVTKMDLLTQKILVLHYLDELSIKDVAVVLSANENTVKTRIYRAITELKERIGENERST